MTPRRILTVMVVLLTGCGNPVDLAGSLTVTSSATSYFLGQAASFTVVNTSRHTVSFPACSNNHPPLPNIRIDRFANGEWTEIDGISGGICPAVTVPTMLPLPPGESMTISVGHTHASHVGTVRIRIMDRGGTTLLGASNSYVVIAD